MQMKKVVEISLPFSSNVVLHSIVSVSVDVWSECHYRYMGHHHHSYIIIATVMKYNTACCLVSTIPNKQVQNSNTLECDINATRAE